MKQQHILSMINDKWGEHLEVLTPRKRRMMVQRILLNTVIRQHNEITFLTRLRSVQENRP